MTDKSSSIVISFRLSKDQFEPYSAIVDALPKGSKSEFYKKVFLTSDGEIKLAEKQSKDSSRVTFLVSKTSNNINQIAKKLNKAYRSKVISESVYIEVLNSLVTIENSMIGAINKC